jgi:hypothetical protein
VRSACFLIAASCASVPSRVDKDLRSVEVQSPGIVRVDGDFELALDDQSFEIGPWFEGSLTRRAQNITISEGSWQVDCTTAYLDEDDRTTTRCYAAGDTPAFELYLEGQPNAEGLIVTDGHEYVISASEGRDEPSALVVQSKGEVQIVVAISNRVWIRRGLDRDRRRALMRIAAVLWATPELR